MFSKAVLEGLAPSVCLGPEAHRSLQPVGLGALCLWMLSFHLEEMPVTLLGLLLAILQHKCCLPPSRFDLGVQHGAGGLDVAPGMVGETSHVQLCSVSLSRNESLGGFFKKLSLSFFPV